MRQGHRWPPTLRLIHLPPSDPERPDTPVVQLTEALERLSEAPLPTRLPLTTALRAE